MPWPVAQCHYANRSEYWHISGCKCPIKTIQSTMESPHHVSQARHSKTHHKQSPSVTTDHKDHPISLALQHPEGIPTAVPHSHYYATSIKQGEARGQSSAILRGLPQEQGSASKSFDQQGILCYKPPLHWLSVTNKPMTKSDDTPQQCS